MHPSMKQVISTYALRNNGKVVFNIDFKKGKIKVNGKNVN